MKRILCFIAVITSTVFLAGCAATSSGTKMSANQVDKIKKGVTTRAEVEANFGTPLNVSVLPDGRRMMTYSYFAMNAKAKITPFMFLPHANLFAGGAIGNQERQMLQVYLTKDNIVEDYEFNNNASVIESSGGLLNRQTITKPIPEGVSPVPTPTAGTNSLTTSRASGTK